MWRGQTQTQGGGAFQAGVDLDYEGFFVGVWGSEVDFGNDSASFEYDLYGGYNFQVSDKLSMSVGVIQFRWDDNDIEMVERHMGDDIAAVMIEGIQGISGIHVPTEDFLRELHKSYLWEQMKELHPKDAEKIEHETE